MKQESKFLQGLLSGVCIGAVIFGVVIFLFGSVLKNNQITDNGSNGSSNSQQTQENHENSTEWSKIEQKLGTLQKMIDMYYMGEIDEEEMEQGIYKGMIASLGDPYSNYYTAEEYSKFMESTEGVYYGIGVTVSQNISTGIITLVKPFPNGPGYEAGLLPGDILYKVGDREVTGVELTEVVNWIKGEEGSTVELTILREGESDYRTFQVERRQIEVPTVEHEMLEDNIGYISILEFDEITAGQFRTAIKNLEGQGMEGLVIDLRDNPGGLLNIVVEMLDRILPEGMVVYTEDKYGNRDVKNSTGKYQFDTPLVVLINGNSASASEIFAGAVQDYGVGTLVGTTTYGKGIVQTLRPLNDGTAVKLTVSKYFTPKGRNIHGTGIEPDIEVELDEELRKKAIIEKEEDNQLQTGIKELKRLIAEE